MDCAELVTRLNERLDVEAYAGTDASTNGLQVGPKSGSIEHVAVAVDAAVATIDEAISLDADLLCVHHGLFWGGLDRLTGRSYDRIRPLIEHEIRCYAAHEPLDGHQELGNAAGVADLLGCTDRSPFGRVGSEWIGQQGTLPQPLELDGLCTALDALDSERVQTLDFGPETIERVAIVTGSGTDWIDEAIDADVDALITGEGKQKAYHQAREAGLTVILGGHYATETFGVRSLQSLFDRWGLETSYISHPTGL